MISIEQSREILGKLGDKLSDKEIENLRNGFYEIINKILDDEYENR